MKQLYDEISARFPEVTSTSFHENHDLPHCLMGSVAAWLESFPDGHLPRSIVERVIDFQTWCENQPRGETSSDDILTIYIVGFFERLFRSRDLLHLIPHLTSTTELQSNSEYLVSWIGLENYESALELARKAEQGAAAPMRVVNRP